MLRHFNLEDLSVCEADDEEDMKRLEQDRRDAEKSQAQMSDACRVRNSRHVPVGPLLRHTRINLATVLAETSNPNLANSAWMRF
jgi:hypothetical protein